MGIREGLFSRLDDYVSEGPFPFVWRGAFYSVLIISRGGYLSGRSGWSYKVSVDSSLFCRRLYDLWPCFYCERCNCPLYFTGVWPLHWISGEL